jgi:two-component system chemotaxis response regulator CheY
MPLQHLEISGTPTVQDLSGLTILVLDDDANMRTLVRDILARHGCQKVLQKRDAQDALDLFSSHSIDLVLSDWSMEPMSGLEFLRELRRPERDARVPVIMLTANSEPQDMLLVKTLGINGWLVKPIAPQRLMSQVARVLSLSDQSILADDDMAEEMAALAERYKSQIANDLRDLDGLLGSILQQQRNTTYTWLAISRLLHRVKGRQAASATSLSRPLPPLAWTSCGGRKATSRCSRVIGRSWCAA